MARMTNEERKSVEELMQMIKKMPPESVKMMVKVGKEIVFFEGLRNECI